MNKPALYHKSHQGMKQDVGQLIKEYSPKLQWRPQGGDTLIDVGSGPGDVSMNYIYPILPANYGKVVFSDISADMLEFFKANYEMPAKSDFKIFDIATTTGLPPDLEGQFDHVTSTLVLHWISDNSTTLKNMFSLLRPEGGDCLIIFFSYTTIYDVDDYMIHSPKWSQYVKNVNRAPFPFQNSYNAKTEFADMMKDAGFCNISVDLKSETYNYGCVKNFIENLTSVCGILDFIPKSRQSEFLDDYVEAFAKYVAQRSGLNLENSKCIVLADLVVAYGQRPPTNNVSKCNKYQQET